MIGNSIYRLYKKIFPDPDTGVEGLLEKGANVKMVNTILKIAKGARLIIKDNVSIEGYSITIEKGEVVLGEQTKLIGKPLEQGRTLLYVQNGSLSISNHCIIKNEFCIRFGGKCIIGAYTGIMEGTEIRVDEEMRIGAYNMISYECMLYDTNTHNYYPKETRRMMTERDFPAIGAEHEKPVTAPVFIGDDCWLGKRCIVLKGVKIGNSAIIAAAAVVTKEIKENYLAYGNPAITKPLTK